MPGWLDQIDGGAAAGRFDQPGRDQTLTKRVVTLPIYDAYTGGSAIECQHQNVDVRGAIAVTVRGKSVVGTWANREFVVYRVVGGSAVAIGAGKTVTPAAPTLELSESDLSGAEYLRIAASGAGSSDVSGVRVELSVTIKENVTPVTRNLPAGTAVSDGGSTLLPE